MSDQCNHDCSNCEESCNSRQRKPTDLHENPHSMSRIDHVIGIMSGKGGVGKSLVTSMLAVKMQKLGYHAAILDADITVPPSPKYSEFKAERPETTLEFCRYEQKAESILCRSI